MSQPITVVVMLDTSGSMTGSDLAAEERGRAVPASSAAGRQGTRRRVQRQDSVQRPLHGQSRRARVSASKDLDYGNGTRLWDAVAASLDELQGIEGRRVILVFTDGDDTQSKARLGTVIERARADEVMVYSIGLESNYFNGQRQVKSKPDGGLKKIADETGGGYFELKKTADLAPTFTRVAQELHSQYVIGFAPTLAR